jgi:hypothetical protein
MWGGRVATGLDADRVLSVRATLTGRLGWSFLIRTKKGFDKKDVPLGCMATEGKERGDFMVKQMLRRFCYSPYFSS